MTDLISKQAAVRWVKTECNPYGNPTIDFESGKKVIEYLEQMPTINSVKYGEWIPCSERIPEHMKLVLICFKEGRDCPYYKIQAGSLGIHDVEDKNFIKTGEVLVWYTERYYYQFDRVAAWMPLPEPYKENEDETD